MKSPMLSMTGLHIEITMEAPYIFGMAGSRRMESTPISPNTIAVTTSDTPTDFAFSPHLG